MNNDITINPDEIRTMEDGSVTDIETIRQISLYGLRTGDTSLFPKIKETLHYAALYPEVMQVHNVLPHEGTKYGRELIFLKRIKPDGSGVEDFDAEKHDWIKDERFKVNYLSMYKKTFIASGMNSYIVKLKDAKIKDTD